MILEILDAMERGEITKEEAAQRIARQPFEQHIIGRFDQNRKLRTGVPEVILAEGKDPAAVRAIYEDYLSRDEQLIASRVTAPVWAALEDLGDKLIHWEKARVVATKAPEPDPKRSTVLVISAGALDTPVAEEAAVMSELFGNPTERLYDVGVAGISRIAVELGRLDRAGILIICAGMDGVLPSLVAGLALQPVIAVPTDVGYGSAFQGVAPLLTMLNSCAPGVAVMNIGNGFGAAVHATKINRLLTRTEPA